MSENKCDQKVKGAHLSYVYFNHKLSWRRRRDLVHSAFECTDMIKELNVVMDDMNINS